MQDDFKEFIAAGNAIVANYRYCSYKLPGCVNTLSLAASDGQGGLKKVEGSEKVAFSEYNSMSEQERYAEKCRSTPNHPDCLSLNSPSEWNSMSAAQKQVHWQAEHCRVMPNASATPIWVSSKTELISNEPPRWMKACE